MALASVGVFAARPAPAEPPTVVPVELQLTEVDGGILDLDGGVPVDHALQFELPVRVEDLRLRVIDGSTRLVPARQHLRLTSRTAVRVVPDAPLQPATSYRAVAEPETGDALKDPHGLPLAIPELSFRTAGEPLPVRPAPHRRRKRRR